MVLKTTKLIHLWAAVRAGGVRVGVRHVLLARRALKAVDPTDQAATYLALRGALCSRQEDLTPFDAAFAEVYVSAGR